MTPEQIEIHLKSLWKPKVSEQTENITFARGLTLIVPHISWDGITCEGSLNNDSWAYCVPYAFRAALDLSFDERMKLKKPYRVWTQGYQIHFKEGDVFISNKGFPSLQVQSSLAMSWDKDNNYMNEGLVNYELFDEVKFGVLGNIQQATQMDFLKILTLGLTKDT